MALLFAKLHESSDYRTAKQCAYHMVMDRHLPAIPGSGAADAAEDTLLRAAEAAELLATSERGLRAASRYATTDSEAREIVARGFVPRWRIPAFPGRALYRRNDILALIGHGYADERVPRAARRAKGGR